MNTSPHKKLTIHEPAARPQVVRMDPHTPGAHHSAVRIFDDERPGAEAAQRQQAATTAAEQDRAANSAEQMHARQVAEAAEQTATAEAAVHQSAEWKAFMLAQENERRLKAAGLKS